MAYRIFGQALNKSDNAVISCVTGRDHKPALGGIIPEGKLLLDKIDKGTNIPFIKAAQQSVLAKTMMCYSIAEKWKDSQIKAFSFCPGYLPSELTKNLPWFFSFGAWLKSLLPGSVSQIEGGLLITNLTFSPDIKSGDYYEKIGKTYKKSISSKLSYSQREQEKLWTWSLRHFNLK